LLPLHQVFITLRLSAPLWGNLNQNSLIIVSSNRIDMILQIQIKRDMSSLYTLINNNHLFYLSKR